MTEDLQNMISSTKPRKKPIIRAEMMDWGLKITLSMFLKDVKS